MSVGNGRGVVVTGASTGIGRACALALAGDGFRVFAGVRRDEDAQSLASEGADGLVPLVFDVTDQASLAAAAEKTREVLAGDGLAGLVNNAGISVSAPLEHVALERLRLQLEVNVVGQVAATQAFLPLVREGKGRIVNIGSVGGRVALPMLGPYNASKFAMEAITDSLRQELRSEGIHVSIVEPGAVDTKIWDKGTTEARASAAELSPEASARYGTLIAKVTQAAEKEADGAAPPKVVADAVAHALTSDRPRTRYPVGRGVGTRIRLRKLLPDRAFDRVVAKALRL